MKYTIYVFLLVLVACSGGGGGGSSVQSYQDKISPDISLVVLVSDNSDDVYFATAGNTLTLTFQTNERINSPTVTIHGASVAAENTIANNWQAQYTVPEHTTDSATAVPFTIDYVDGAGNKGETIKNTILQQQVYLQRTQTPQVVAERISDCRTTNRVEPIYVRQGDNLCLMYQFSKAINKPDIRIAFSNTSYQLNLYPDGELRYSNEGRRGYANWIGEYRVQQADTGVMRREINYKDLADKTSDSAMQPTQVHADNQPPTIHVLPNRQTESSISFEVDISEDASISYARIAHEHAKIEPSVIESSDYSVSLSKNDIFFRSPIRLYLEARDRAGNTSVYSQEYTDYTVDNTDAIAPPTNIRLTASNNIIKNGDATLAFDFTGDSSTDVKVFIGASNIDFSIDGNSYSATYQVTELTRQGALAFAIAITRGGKTGVIRRPTQGSIPVVDNSPPQVNVGMSSSNQYPYSAKAGDTITVRLHASEQLDNNKLQATFLGKSADIAQDGNGDYSISYVVKQDTSNDDVAFSFRDIADIHGNALPGEIDAVTYGRAVAIDTQPPQIAEYTSDFSGDQQALTYGDAIQLDFTTDSEVFIPEISINGLQAVVSQRVSRRVWTAQVQIQQTDTLRKGALQAEFHLQDLAGNQASDSKMLDGELTVGTSLSITVADASSDNNSPSLAKAGDTITLVYSTDESIDKQKLAITLADRDASVDMSANRATLQVREGDPNGKVAYTISYEGVSVASGKLAVTIDTMPPQVTQLRLTTSRMDKRAKVGDTIYADFSTDELLLTPPQVTFAEQMMQISGSARAWRALLTVNDSITDGEYNADSLMFTLADQAGNQITSAGVGSASITVDTQPPVVRNARISLIDSNNNGRGDIDETIEVFFVVSDDSPLEDDIPQVTIAGKVATVEQSGDGWRAYRAIVPEDPRNSEVEKSISVNVADILDNRHNQTITGVSGNVSIDSGAPALKARITSNGNTVGNITYAKQSETITLDWSSDEDITIDGVTIAGSRKTATATPSGQSKIWQATMPVDNNTPQGDVTFDIRYRAISSEVTARVTRATDNSRVTVDTIAPGIVIEDPTPTRIGKNQTFTLVFDVSVDSATPVVALSGYKSNPTLPVGKQIETQQKQTWQATYTTPDENVDETGNLVFTVQASDNAGNASQPQSITILFDGKKPALQVRVHPSGNPDSRAFRAGQDITIDITSDELLPNPPIITIGSQTFPMPAVPENQQSYSSQLDISELADDSYIVLVDYSDDLGNSGQDTIATIRKDTTPPSANITAIQADTPAGIGDTITVTFDISADAAGDVSMTIAGIKTSATYAQGNGQATYTVQEGNQATSSNVRLHAFTDSAGNQSGQITSNADITVDAIRPHITSSSFSVEQGDAPAGRGDTIVYALAFNEPLNIQPQVNIVSGIANGINTAFAYNGVTANSYGYKYTIAQDAVQSGNTFRLSITGITDTADNTADTTTDMTTDFIDIPAAVKNLRLHTLALGQYSNITADISWDAEQNVSYDIEYRLVGAPQWQESGTRSLTRLIPDTSYDARVRQSRGVWSQITFNTAITPASEGARIWYEAKDISADGVMPADGAVVKTLRDKSGNNNHAIYYTAERAVCGSKSLRENSAKATIATLSDGQKVLDMSNRNTITAYETKNAISADPSIDSGFFEVYLIFAKDATTVTGEEYVLDANKIPPNCDEDAQRYRMQIINSGEVIGRLPKSSSGDGVKYSYQPTTDFSADQLAAWTIGVAGSQAYADSNGIADNAGQFINRNGERKSTENKRNVDLAKGIGNMLFFGSRSTGAKDYQFHGKVASVFLFDTFIADYRRHQLERFIASSYGVDMEVLRITSPENGSKITCNNGSLSFQVSWKAWENSSYTVIAQDSQTENVYTVTNQTATSAATSVTITGQCEAAKAIIIKVYALNSAATGSSTGSSQTQADFETSQQGNIKDATTIYVRM